jgi:hypothetical protein
MLLIALGVTTVNGMFSSQSGGIVLVEEETHGSKSSKDSPEAKDKSLPPSFETHDIIIRKVHSHAVDLFKPASHSLIPEIPPELA